MGESREELLKKVREEAKKGKMPCLKAWKLAEELAVPRLEVGKAANELGIKIVQCELGCF